MTGKPSFLSSLPPLLAVPGRKKQQQNLTGGEERREGNSLDGFSVAFKNVRPFLPSHTHNKLLLNNAATFSTTVHDTKIPFFSERFINGSLQGFPWGGQ